MDRAQRPFRLGAFAISGGRVIAADEVAPIAIEIDIETGELRAVHTWPVPSFSGEPVANAVAVVDDSIVIASPAAGGLVCIERSTAAVTTTALDAPIGRLLVDGSTVWAIAHADRNADVADDRLGRRPVVWVDPTAEEVEEYRHPRHGWVTVSRMSDTLETVASDADQPDFDWRNEPNDDQDIIGPPTPVWRIKAGVAELVDFGGRLGRLVPLVEGVLAECTLPTDPIIKRIHPSGRGLSFEHPASVVFRTPESGFERVAALPPFGRVWKAGDRAVLIELDEHDTGRHTFRTFDPVHKTFSQRSPLAVDEPVAALGNHIVDLRRARPGEPSAVRIVPLDGGAATSIPLPNVDLGWSAAAVVGTEIWFRTRDETALVGVDTDTGTVRQVRLDIDCGPFVPATPTVGASTSSLTLPVMLASWELECCQPDAVVGEPWTAYLLLADAEPWWLEHATDPVPDDVRDLGVVDFEGTVLRAARDREHVGLVATGPVRVAVPGVRDEQHQFRGAIRHEAHGEFDGILTSENECVGVVQRIQGIAYRRERRVLNGESGSVPVAQEPPVELPSTTGGDFESYLLTIEFGPDATP